MPVIPGRAAEGREGKGTHLPSPFLDPLPKARNASLAGGDTGWREGKIAIA
ncbi:MAG: hypothetical protein JO124_19535 [Hyphomicrobiales bacterium]|nr:hypothetical protein [Hyphomicrobiales bacterium]